MFEIGHPLGDMCVVSRGLSCSAQVGGVFPAPRGTWGEVQEWELETWIHH